MADLDKTFSEYDDAWWESLSGIPLIRKNLSQYLSSKNQMSVKEIIDYVACASRKCDECQIDCSDWRFDRTQCPAYVMGNEMIEGIPDLISFVSVQLKECYIPTKNKEIKSIIEHIIFSQDAVPPKSQMIFYCCIEKIMMRIDAACLLKEKSLDICKSFPEQLKEIGYDRAKNGWVENYVRKHNPSVLNKTPKKMPQNVDEHEIIIAARQVTPPLITNGNCWHGSKVMLATLVSLLFKNKGSATLPVDWKLVDKVFEIDGEPVSGYELKNSFHAYEASPCKEKLMQIIPAIKEYI